MRIDMTNKNDNIDFILGAGFILSAVDPSSDTAL